MTIEPGRRRTLTLAAATALTVGVTGVGGFAWAARLTSRVGSAGPCATQLRLGSVRPDISITREGRPVVNPVVLQAGDTVRTGRRGSLRFNRASSRYILVGGSLQVTCRRLILAGGARSRLQLVPNLLSGRLRAGSSRGTVAAITPEALIVAHRGGASFQVLRMRRVTEAIPTRTPIEVAELRIPRVRIRVRPTQTGIMDRHGLRLDVYPFAVSPMQRPVRPADGLPEFWNDGQACSVGCPQPGVSPGWPLRPFHRQHPLRAGLNELRPSGMHVGVDIEARDGQEVYALSSGPARLLRAGTVDESVQVGQLIYWHIRHAVAEGQHIAAYHTPLGRILPGFRHLHLSELIGGEYLNPLRPGGRSLAPYTDTEPPVIGIPRIVRSGRVIVGAFDPQSDVDTDYQYHTPVLAPAALAWRLYDTRGRALTGVEWALRGSHHLADGEKNTVYAPGATNPGFWCFIRRRLCKPVWRYWLAGGLTSPLPIGSLTSGHLYRLTVYAEDWAGNRSALDYRFRWPSGNAQMANPAAVGLPTPRYDG